MTHSCFCQVQRLLHILFCFCHPDSPFCRHGDGVAQTTWHALFAPSALIVVTVVTYSRVAQTTRHALFAPSALIVVTVVTYSIKFSRCFVQARHLKILPNACLVVCTQKDPCRGPEIYISLLRYLLSSRLYCRLWNCTKSAMALPSVAGCYRR